ncbi:helix-turn-helix domain-containing protein [Allomuricauda taeanensis]|uniref:helix-turn-helix transcriptional regulator n=1 Tax=Flagellimonas taeanensis TaxID=1005926 RepID=UPI002E7B19C2|nr:helix-turn-helix domain-containing protein [Allomuricauda taeanensis]MEE1962048.1 helix-turn-helix domain-containing protein [Allomuricauda taeanensis]
MDRPENKKRLEKLFSQLVELSNGNFSYRIERTEKKDALEALAFLVNSATERISDAFLHQGFVNLQDSHSLLVQLFFELDQKGIVRETNKMVGTLLKYEHSDLDNVPFVTLLSPKSHKGWSKIVQAMKIPSPWEIAIRLVFSTGEGLLFPAQCNIIHFPNNAEDGARTIITSFDIIQKKSVKESELKRKIEKQLRSHVLLPKETDRNSSILHASDIEKLRVVEKYIKDNLAEPLPSLKEIASFCGTNEFKLKKGFKELYGLTAFQYQKKERLRKAHVLLEHTNIKVTTIAKMIGLKKGNHLAREFRKRYGYSPTELRMLSK